MKLTIYFSVFFKKWNWQISSCSGAMTDNEINFIFKEDVVGKVDRLIDLPCFPEELLREAFITIV